MKIKSVTEQRKEREKKRKEELEKELKQWEKAREKRNKAEAERKKQAEKEKNLKDAKATVKAFEAKIKEFKNICKVYKLDSIVMDTSDIQLVSFSDSCEKIGITKEEADDLDRKYSTALCNQGHIIQDLKNGNEAACLFVLANLSSLNKNPYTNKSWKASLVDKEHLVIELISSMESVIPRKQISLTETGKIREEDYTKTDYYEMCLNFACGCLCVAIRDIFALCPTVQCVSAIYSESRIEPETGIKAKLPLIRCELLREQVKKVKFDTIEPSGFIISLNPDINFIKTKGLQPLGKNKKKIVEINDSADENVEVGNFIADELLKLKSLMDMGVLSEEEFEKQKSKILGL